MQWQLIFILANLALVVRAINPCDLAVCSCSDDTLSCECSETNATRLPNMDMDELPDEIERYKVSRCNTHTMSAKHLGDRSFRSYQFNKIKQLTFLNNTFTGSIDYIAVTYSSVYVFHMAIVDAGIGDLTFDHSVIEQFGPQSIRTSSVRNLRIFYTFVPVLPKFHYESSFRQIRIEYSQINVMATRAIDVKTNAIIAIKNSVVNSVQTQGIQLTNGLNGKIEVRIINNTFGHLEDQFMISTGLQNSHITFENNHVRYMTPWSMDGMDVKDVKVKNNYFESVATDITVRDNQKASSNLTLMQANTFRCTPQLCRTVRYPIRNAPQYSYYESLLLTSSTCLGLICLHPDKYIVCSEQEDNVKRQHNLD